MRLYSCTYVTLNLSLQTIIIVIMRGLLGYCMSLCVCVLFVLKANLEVSYLRILVTTKYIHMRK